MDEMSALVPLAKTTRMTLSQKPVAVPAPRANQRAEPLYMKKAGRLATGPRRAVAATMIQKRRTKRRWSVHVFERAY
jgi:hypothetical protein